MIEGSEHSTSTRYEWASQSNLETTIIYSNDSEKGNAMNAGDRFQVTLDVEVIQVNNERPRLQLKRITGQSFGFGMALNRCQSAHASEAGSTCTFGVSV